MNLAPEKEICVTCRQPKATHQCGICEGPICRPCGMFLDDQTFAFQAAIPDELKHNYYCQACYDIQVVPALTSYQEVLERAKGVYFFFNSRKKHVPTLKKSREDVEVLACADRDETILRLGFLAAQQNYNAIIDADVFCEKVRNFGWQKSVWRGSGRPANVDAEKMDRRIYE